MITPRRTRLLRVPDLQRLQRAIAQTAFHSDGWRTRDCAVIVPTQAAAGQLRRTLENLILDQGPGPVAAGPQAGANSPGSAPPVRPRRAMVLPELLTRDDWYARMHDRLAPSPPRLSEFEREVCARAAARDAVEAGADPPFTLRAGLVAEILSLYDNLRRQGRTVDAFERLMVEELEPSADIDRGASRMLRQTRFLVLAFYAYERRVASTGRLDEHGLRQLLLERAAIRPFRHVIVTVADRAFDPAGLWRADFDLLARAPGFEEVDVIATETLLEAGFHARVHELLPGLEEQREAAPRGEGPVLLAPGHENDGLWFTSRDREEELAAVARVLKGSRPPGATPPDGGRDTVHGIDDRTAVVFQRPLPYLYLARQVFEGSGVPFEALDALPLAVEPYAAAVDLVFAFVTSGFTRVATIDLLRSPHFEFAVDGRRVGPREVAALDRALQAARYLGGRERLAELAAKWTAACDFESVGAREDWPAAHAATVAAGMAAELQLLESPGPASERLDVLLAFLRSHQAPLPASESLRERHLRARAAILGAVQSLRDAHAVHDDAVCDFAELVSAIRRWIEGQTFAPRTGTGGVHLVDPDAARYGDFAEVRIVGLVDREWPERPPRNIFYPSSVLGALGWPRDTERLRGARAAFRDLLRLSADRVSLSTFTLEDDAIVSPSTFLEDIADASLTVVRGSETPAARVSVDPAVPWVVDGDPAEWRGIRLGRAPAAAPEFHGAAGPQAPSTYAVSAVERYLECPFKFFARSRLRLEEEPDDEPTMTPRARGRFVHQVFRTFFDVWQRSGRGTIAAGQIGAALEEFERVAETLLADLADADRTLERTRLLGSAAGSGLAERVFRLEAERPERVLERLLEYSFGGEFELTDAAGTRSVHLRGTADRIDLLVDGTLQVIDYKTRRPPRLSRAVQLPIYSVSAAQRLEGRHGRAWRVGEGGYIAFGDPRTFVSMVPRGMTLAGSLAAGQERFLQALADIERGEFPPRPAELFLCSYCPYPAVCRKDYVGEQ